jgi:hypothetical protein
MYFIFHYLSFHKKSLNQTKEGEEVKLLNALRADQYFIKLAMLIVALPGNNFVTRLYLPG